MGIDDPSGIDALGTGMSTGIEVLTIMDAWDWTDEQAHLLALAAKINACLGFVESGQLIEEHPHTDGRRCRIDILSRFPFPPHLDPFIQDARRVAASYGVGVDQRLVCEISAGAPRAEG